MALVRQGSIMVIDTCSLQWPVAGVQLPSGAGPRGQRGRLRRRLHDQVELQEVQVPEMHRLRHEDQLGHRGHQRLV